MNSGRPLPLKGFLFDKIIKLVLRLCQINSFLNKKLKLYRPQKWVFTSDKILSPPKKKLFRLVIFLLMKDSHNSLHIYPFLYTLFHLDKVLPLLTPFRDKLLYY